MLSDVRVTLVSQTERQCRKDSGGNTRFFFFWFVASIMGGKEVNINIMEFRIL